MERGSERPGLGPVDDDLDEARHMVVAQSTLRLTRRDVVPSDPPFVRRAVQIGASFSGDGGVVDSDGVVLGDAAALSARN